MNFVDAQFNLHRQSANTHVAFVDDGALFVEQRALRSSDFRHVHAGKSQEERRRPLLDRLHAKPKVHKHVRLAWQLDALSDFFDELDSWKDKLDRV